MGGGCERGRLVRLQHIVERGVHPLDQGCHVGKPDETHVETDREILAGWFDPGVRMLDPTGIVAMERNEGRIELALLELGQEFAAPGDQMRDLGDQSAMIEAHQGRIGERTAFNPQAHAVEVGEAGDPLARRLAREHHRQRREVIGPGRG